MLDQARLPLVAHRPPALEAASRQRGRYGPSWALELGLRLPPSPQSQFGSRSSPKLGDPACFPWGICRWPSATPPCSIAAKMVAPRTKRQHRTCQKCPRNRTRVLARCADGGPRAIRRIVEGDDPPSGARTTTTSTRSRADRPLGAVGGARGLPLLRRCEPSRAREVGAPIVWLRKSILQRLHPSDHGRWPGRSSRARAAFRPACRAREWGPSHVGPTVRFRDSSVCRHWPARVVDYAAVVLEAGRVGCPHQFTWISLSARSRFRRSLDVACFCLHSGIGPSMIPWGASP